jgi:P27 family predicted phage terminase small subunit
LARKTSPTLKVVPITADPLPKVPAHLGDAGRALWHSIMTDYQITDAGGLALLGQACEACDRVAECRELIAAQGAVVRSQGAVRAHPLLAAERDARAAMLRALRYLNLDVEPLKAIGRPLGSVRS